MIKEFHCNGKRLADYLIKHGSKLINTEFINGEKVYVFEHDDSIDDNLKQWDIAKKRCLF